MNGRWIGGEYVWDCPGCGCMRCARAVPGDEDAKCLRCRTDEDLLEQICAAVGWAPARAAAMELTTRVYSLARDVERLQQKVERLEREQGRAA